MLHTFGYRVHVFSRVLASNQGRTQDLELGGGGGGGGAQRAESRKRGWVREGGSPPPASARGYGGAL